MKKFFVVNLFLFIFGIAVVSESADFDWSVYQTLVANEEIDQAARCESLDAKIYGKPLFDYQVESLAKLIVTGIAHQNQMLELELAYNVVKSFHLGRADGYYDVLKNKSEAVFLKASKELGCHTKYNKN